MDGPVKRRSRFFIVNISPLKSVNIFERMKIAESIYEVAVETSYKEPSRAYANHAVNRRKMRGEAAS